MDRAGDILKEFEIGLFSLKNKVHSFEYQIGNTFFECFENSPLEQGDFQLSVLLDKSERLLQFEVSIKGSSKLICDRSLDEFDFPIESSSKVVYKYGESYQELSEDLIVIPEGTEKLNLATVLYELIAVEIPFKKLHPRFLVEDEDLDEEEELEVVYLDEDFENEETEEQIDPRWEDLKKKFEK